MDYAPTRLVVVQATPFCNINCSYCYLAERNDRRRISLDVVETICDRLLEWNRFTERVDILWHAGEPLVLSAEFYSAAFHRFRRLQAQGIRISHAFQTNGLLVTDAHCRLFREHDVSVGVSLDGPEDIHDVYRRTRNDKGTYRAVVAGIGKLQFHGLAPSALAVLTRHTLCAPDRFYDCYAALGIRFVGLNILEKEGANELTFFDDADVTTDCYARFVERIFERSLREGTVHFRELVNLIDLIANRGFPVRYSENIPGDILSFTADGRVGTYSPELLDVHSPRYGSFCGGNVSTSRIVDVLDGICGGAIGADIASGVARCRADCAYFPVCGGGGPANKLGEAGSFDVSTTRHCTFTKKALTEVALKLLEDPDRTTLAHWRAGYHGGSPAGP